jgi:thiamine-phosphate pyrophosphorylase
VQYREKHKSTAEKYEEALKIRRLCRKAVFLVNDRVDIALAVNADGVHLGQDDLPYPVARRLLGRRKIIGLTVHNVRQAEEAQRLGADYVGVSAIFSTTTKQDAPTPCGPGMIKRIKEMVTVPVIAIGGINLENAREVIRAGADGLCSISAVVTKSNVRSEIAKFQKLF